jgi:hypothetical protein
MSDFKQASKSTSRNVAGAKMAGTRTYPVSLLNGKVFFPVAALFLWAASMHAQLGPAPNRCSNQKHLVILSLNDSGRSVEGPVCAQIVVNVLRYDVDFGKTVSTTPGPNLTGIFPKSFDAGGGADLSKAKGLDDQFKEYSATAQKLQANLLQAEAGIRKTGSDTDQYLLKLRGLIVQTDSILKPGGGPQGVIKLLHDPETKKEMDAALNNAFNWQTTDEIVQRLQQVQASVNALPINFPVTNATITGDPCGATNIGQLGWPEWSKCRDSQYKAVLAIVAAALTEAAPFTSDGDRAAKFSQKVRIIQYWKNTITTLDEGSFTLQTQVDCGLLFNRNEQTILKLLMVDRTSIFDGPLAGAQTKDGLLTVTCTSPFAVTAGAAFSTISNQQFSIVKSAPAPGATTSVNKFGVTSDPKVTPYPIAMAHARLKDWADNRYALHFSFGIGAKLAGDSSGGSSPEFLMGPSISFLRTIFVTAGLDVGKKSKLIGGFNVGDTVPTDITAPPVSSSYMGGFGFAITFTKP